MRLGRLCAKWGFFAAAEIAWVKATFVITLRKVLNSGAREVTMIDLKDKLALVTGGSRGIGAAIVETLAGAGASVILHYGRSAEAAAEIAKQLGPDRCYPVSANLEDRDAVPDLWKRAISWRGRVDILVNNASTRPVVEPD